MTPTHAVLLGVVQGLTEFLPVSSSGHLVILQSLFGFSTPPVAFDVLLHVATLVAVIAVFWHDLRNVTRPFLIALAAGTIPTGMIGMLLVEKAESLFMNLPLLSAGYAITTLMLLSTLLIPRLRHRTKASVDPLTAVLIGIVQGIAVIPSISRSGATIVAAMWLGVERREAARFSFLLSIPAILGAQLLELPNLINNDELTLPVAIIGFVSSLIVGWLSLRWLLAMIKGRELHWFALYTGLLAAITAIV